MLLDYLFYTKEQRELLKMFKKHTLTAPPDLISALSKDKHKLEKKLKKFYGQWEPDDIIRKSPARSITSFLESLERGARNVHESDKYTINILSSLSDLSETFEDVAVKIITPEQLGFIKSHPSREDFYNKAFSSGLCRITLKTALEFCEKYQLQPEPEWLTVVMKTDESGDKDCPLIIQNDNHHKKRISFRDERSVTSVLKHGKFLFGIQKGYCIEPST